jgi:hypothetical protein
MLDWEQLSYIVTVIGLPFAIAVYLKDQRQERQNDEEEIYQRLSDEYAEFCKIIIDNADLRLRTQKDAPPALTPEQEERRLILFEMLVALFERAYILVYEDDMSRQQRRLWQSWEDYMRDWCEREDFRELLPRLLAGEDEDFSTHILRIAAEVAHRPAP